jgi:hypothetical protein|nr:MAG TPA: hypothetical protein [Caudoviricetes sp.]
MPTPTSTLDIYDRTFDLEKVHLGTCLSINDGEWFVFRIPDGWVDDHGDTWTSESLIDYVEDGMGLPRFKRLN